MKRRNIIFICELAQHSFKIMKLQAGDGPKREFLGAQIEAMPEDTDVRALTVRLVQLFKKLGYSNNPLIISLPRGKATCRYLKVPTQVPAEIEKIVSLQAQHYLPYTNDELITGYQVISSDQGGYSYLNLVIAHKKVVEPYLKIIKELKAGQVTIALSSYGLLSIFNYLRPEEPGPVMLIDIDRQQAEFAIIAQQKLLFSRYSKLDYSSPSWENLLLEEARKSRDAYLKETFLSAPGKIVVIGCIKAYSGIAQVLAKKADIPVEVLTYDKISMHKDVSAFIQASEYSFSGLIGLGQKNIEENLNLVPLDIKEKNKATLSKRKAFHSSLIIITTIVALFLSSLKGISNKSIYLRLLNSELSKISKDAGVLEEIEKRIELMRRNTIKEVSIADLICELYKIMPDGVFLTNLSYEEGAQVVLRGQAPELNSVFDLVGRLERSPVFRRFNIKVRYATQKTASTAPLVDFEVICAKK